MAVKNKKKAIGITIFVLIGSCLAIYIGTPLFKHIKKGSTTIQDLRPMRPRAFSQCAY